MTSYSIFSMCKITSQPKIEIMYWIYFCYRFGVALLLLILNPNSLLTVFCDIYTYYERDVWTWISSKLK